MFETTEHPKTPTRDQVGTTFIQDCARCDGHHDVDVFSFEQPPNDFTHWAICPTLREPILIEEYDA